jgi:hypothetical protein
MAKYGDHRFMKSDIEKKIDARVAAVFADIIPAAETKAGQEILKHAQH